MAVAAPLIGVAAGGAGAAGAGIAAGAGAAGAIGAGAGAAAGAGGLGAALGSLGGVGGVLQGAGTVASIAGQLGSAGASSKAAAVNDQITAINVGQIGNDIDWTQWKWDYENRKRKWDAQVTERLNKYETQAMKLQSVHMLYSAKRDAEMLRKQGKSVMEHASESMRRVERAGYEQSERIRGGFAKGGVVADSGTAALVTDQAIRDAEMQEQEILNRAIDQRNLLNYQAANREYEGKVGSDFMNMQADMNRWAGQSQAFHQLVDRNFARYDHQQQIRKMRIQQALGQLYGAQQSAAYNASASAARAGAFATGLQGFGGLVANQKKYGV